MLPLKECLRHPYFKGENIINEKVIYTFLRVFSLFNTDVSVPDVRERLKNSLKRAPNLHFAPKDFWYFRWLRGTYGDTMVFGLFVIRFLSLNIWCPLLNYPSRSDLHHPQKL